MQTQDTTPSARTLLDRMAAYIKASSEQLSSSPLADALLAEYRAQKAQPQISQETARELFEALSSMRALAINNGMQAFMGWPSILKHSAKTLARAEAELKEGK